MTDEPGNPSDGDSRRSFMKKGALTSGALALGLGSAGSAAAQETPTETPGGDGIDEEGGLKALVFSNAFHPGARFTFVSGVVDWSPDVPSVRDNLWANYDTYMIRWLNTNEIVPLFVDSDANIGGEFDENLGFIPDLDDDANQPQLWEMEREVSLLGDSGQLVSVNFSPVAEEQEDAILQNDDWWQDGGGTGGGGGGTPTGTPGGGGGTSTDTPGSG